jgi:hypothetical protein
MGFAVVIFSLWILEGISITTQWQATNGFTQSDVENWKESYNQWKIDGLPRSKSVMNCSTADASDPIHDREKTFLGFKTDMCGRTILRGLCGGLGRTKGVVPHSQLCSGRIREFGNYR